MDKSFVTVRTTDISNQLLKRKKEKKEEEKEAEEGETVKEIDRKGLLGEDSRRSFYLRFILMIIL